MMRISSWVFVLLLIALAWVSVALAGDLPDAKLTPGAVRPVTLEELCSTKTSTVRHVTPSVKRAVYEEYSVIPKADNECPEGYEVDHLISLELGGSNEAKNLWPQSYCGQWNAHMKDVLENKLHRLICDGVISMEQAQHEISTDWISAYTKYIQK